MDTETLDKIVRFWDRNAAPKEQVLINTTSGQIEWDRFLNGLHVAASIPVGKNIEMFVATFKYAGYTIHLVPAADLP